MLYVRASKQTQISQHVRRSCVTVCSFPQAMFFNGKTIEVAIPKQMVFEVLETDPGEKGNTAQGGSKVSQTIIS